MAIAASFGSQRNGAGPSPHSTPKHRMPREAMAQPPDAALPWTTAIHCSGPVSPCTTPKAQASSGADGFPCRDRSGPPTAATRATSPQNFPYILPTFAAGSGRATTGDPLRPFTFIARSTRCVKSSRNPSWSTAPKPRPNWGYKRPRSTVRSQTVSWFRHRNSHLAAT